MPLAATHARSPSRVHALLLLALSTIAACDGPAGRAGPVALPSAHRGLNRSDSLSRGLLGSGSGQAGSDGVTVTSDAVAIVSLDPGNFQGFDQPETIVGIVSGRVGAVSVRGSGAIKCTGTYGTIIGYDSSGVELGRQDLALINPADCSTPENPDDVTFGAQGTLRVTNGIIKRFEITPMSPLEFPVFDLTGRASATYTIGLEEAPPGLNVTCTPATSTRATVNVSCVATMSDGSNFTPKHVKSTTYQGTVIIEGDVAEPPAPRFEWRGPAVVSSKVEITATIASGDIVGKGSFTVTSRIGKVANWMSEDFPDTGFDYPIPRDTFATTSPPFTAVYPGFVFVDSLLTDQEGTLGQTILPYPQAPLFGSVPQGPNQSVTFVTSVPWGVDPFFGSLPTRIYIEQSLNRTDAFYKKQKGPSPYCTQKQMDSLYQAVQRHEQLHWAYAHTTLDRINLLGIFDSLAVLPFSEGGNQRAADTWLQLREAWRDSVNSSIARTHESPDAYPNCRVKP